MMKSAARSKRRLAAAIGDTRATQAAQHLIACAREDLESWPGPVCLAPADDEEAAALEPASVDALVVQRGDNLGERINHVNAALIDRGLERQLYVGIDCPAIDLAYLERAAAALVDRDVVLRTRRRRRRGAHGRARPLAGSFGSALEHGRTVRRARAGCARAGARAAVLEPLRDVDTLEDLRALRTALAGDSRPARRALSRWLAQQPDLRGA